MHHAALNYEPDGINASTKISKAAKGNQLNKTLQVNGSVTRVTDLSTLVGANAIPVDYLIITHSSLFNSNSLTTLANHRRDYNGYDVVICQVDASGSNNDIYDYEDTPGHIKYPSTLTTRYLSVRNFIADVYTNGQANHTGDGHLGYILLAGDALQDNNSNVMVPAATPSYYGGYEQGGDYYYTCTGGDADDFQDVMYGRLSVGNETELNNVVNKINSYEANTNGNWNSNSTFVSFSPDLWYDYSSDNAIRDMTAIIPPTIQKSYAFRAYNTDPTSLVTEANPIYEQRFTENQFNGIPPFPPDDPYNLCGAKLLEDWLYTKINSGIHTFVYEGHGGRDALGANEGCGRYIFKSSYIFPPCGYEDNTINTRLANNFYSFMIFNSCDAGHLDHTSGDCVAEAVVNIANKGAIGVVASSRDSDTGGFGVVDKLIVAAQYNSLSHIMG